LLTETQLQQIMPTMGQALASTFLPLLESTFEEFGISTPPRQAMFLAQAAHESGELRHLEENLNYSAEGLLATWPRRFDPQLATQLAHHPDLIANHVYGDRLGNSAPGDGWKYRGRSIFQLTGLAAYANASHKLGVDLVASPDLVAQPPMACRTAGLYWRENGLSDLADKGDLQGVTRRINGGLTGLAQRAEYFKRAKVALGVELA
jgi:putative chitinase